MNSELLYVLSNSFRFILISITCHGVSTVVQAVILGTKRSLKYLIIYFLIKITFINTLLGIVLKELYKDVYNSNEWLRILYTVCMLTAAVLTYVMFVYTFHGEFIRVAVVAWIGEMMSAFLGYFSVGVINTLEGRDFFSYIGTLRIMDLGIPIICYSLLAIIYHCCRPILKKIRNYELRHKKALWVLFIIYTTMMTCPSFLEHRAGVRISILAILLSMAVVFVLLFLTLKRYRRNLAQEHDFLDTQQKLMKLHYQNLVGEMKRIELCRKETELQMQNISDMKDSFSKQRQIFEYRESLLQEYQKMKAGVYCDDWMLDAMLSSQSELLENHGIRLKCSLQEYKNRTVSRQDLLPLILTLIHWSIRANAESDNQQQKWIWLQMSTIKNQLIIQFAGSWDGKERISKNMVKRYIRKYDGSIQVEKHTGEVKFTIAL